MDGATAVNVRNRPAWLDDVHELPHEPIDLPLWNETYLAYVYSPANETGVWFHLRHVPTEYAKPGLWDVVMFIALPGDQFLVSKTFAPGRVDRLAPGSGEGAFHVAGLSWQCTRPFAEWTLHFRGAARAVSGDELRAGPLRDGPHIPVEVELDVEMITPAWDHNASPGATWEKQHYAQHLRGRGHIEHSGRTIPLDGMGERDHSWGPRDFGLMGNATWIHGRTEAGRGYSITYVEGESSNMLDSKVGDGSGVHRTEATGIPLARTVAETKEDAEFVLTNPDGSASTVRTHILTTCSMHHHQPSEFCFGASAGDPGDCHDYVVSFVRVDWGGESCIGYDDRCVRRS